MNSIDNIRKNNGIINSLWRCCISLRNENLKKYIYNYLWIDLAMIYFINLLLY